MRWPMPSVVVPRRMTLSTEDRPLPMPRPQVVFAHGLTARQLLQADRGDDVLVSYHFDTHRPALILQIGAAWELLAKVQLLDLDANGFILQDRQGAILASTCPNPPAILAHDGQGHLVWGLHEGVSHVGVC